ncbi:winged helix-turn-helix domain-containing protein [Mesorhizobium sp. RP14(2022)]|uniref:Winged helix-turn-helix domain-containing protein n=1 Tax=Mesorhizobium liriopis TaxID=2953882 RepID=A0ABT1CB38_9HYPH|nr:HTH domain-containing protein [Mesorhizobium liriopis]MCO6051395.1 winged helix-turn-helix domain-containing protein [Mesorhizobium liriopis]
MTSRYLKIAEQVLLARGQPMSAQHIMESAKRFDLLPRQFSGSTMQKTLQARIAEDIFTHKSRSKFYRTGQGIYFLRSKANSPELNERLTAEHTTNTRRQPLNRHRILHIPHSSRAEVDFVSIDGMRADILSSDYLYLRSDTLLYPAFVFTIVATETHILTCRVGKYSNTGDISGMISGGLRRFIDEFDLDLIDGEITGEIRSSIRSCEFYFDYRAMDQDDRDIRQRTKTLFCAFDNRSHYVGVVALYKWPENSFDKLRVKRRLDAGNMEWTPWQNWRARVTDDFSKAVLEHIENGQS